MNNYKIKIYSLCLLCALLSCDDTSKYPDKVELPGYSLSIVVYHANADDNTLSDKLIKNMTPAINEAFDCGLRISNGITFSTGRIEDVDRVMSKYGFRCMSHYAFCLGTATESTDIINNMLALDKDRENKTIRNRIEKLAANVNVNDVVCAAGNWRAVQQHYDLLINKGMHPSNLRK